MIWKQAATTAHMNAVSRGTMVEHLGIVFTDVGADYIEASMPVNERTVQPYGILHGGASVALSESLGSTAAYLCIADPSEYTSVGVEINANHLRSVRAGEEVIGALHQCVSVAVSRSGISTFETAKSGLYAQVA